jgi:tRNA A58 N-methylase Trm61
MTALQESLSKCRVEGNTIFLPPITDGALPNYNEVRTALLKAGAKYKRNTFVFSSDAQPFIDRLMSGASVNIKKEFQFFPTPPDIADWLVELAEIQEHHCVLEPSAGQGAIVDAIQRVIPGMHVFCYELMPENVAILSKKNHTTILGTDFLKHAVVLGPDRIIANPPFSNNQDIDHIRKMYDILQPGGVLVSACSKHWQLSKNRKETEFREWLDKEIWDMGYQYDIPAGRFKDSGTMIATQVLVIGKP